MRPLLWFHAFEERPVANGRRVALELQTPQVRFPGVLLLPDAAASGSVPAALLLHGLTSRGDVMVNSVGLALLRRGVASFAPDLPMHGDRAGALELANLRNPLEIVRLWRLALDEAKLGLDFLGRHENVDARRLAVVGYSLGSFLGVALAARELRVRGVVLAAGGDLPSGSTMTILARTIADPVRDVRKLGERPLLMINGRHDPVIRADQAQRLFDAATEPKELRWYEAGHTLPGAAIEAAADWLTGRLHEIRADA